LLKQHNIAKAKKSYLVSRSKVTQMISIQWWWWCWWWTYDVIYLYMWLLCWDECLICLLMMIKWMH